LLVRFPREAGNSAKDKTDADMIKHGGGDLGWMAHWSNTRNFIPI